MTDRRFGSLCVELDEVDAKGTPVVMVHGLGGSSNTFTPLLERPLGRPVLRIDLPGAARSAARASLRNLDGLVAALDQSMRSCGFGHAHLVGHSLGTLVCRAFANRRPDAVASLCLYGALEAPADAARLALRDRAAMARRDGMAAIASRVADSSLAPDAHPAARAFVRESLMRQRAFDYAAHCELLAAVERIDSSGLSVPVTFVVGVEDAVSPVAMADALAASMRQASVVRLAGVGHWPTLEAPRQARDALEAHLRRGVPRDETLRGTR